MKKLTKVKKSKNVESKNVVRLIAVPKSVKTAPKPKESREPAKTTPYSVRLTEELKDKLSTIAKRECRSLSGLMAYVLLNYAIGDGKVHMVPARIAP